MQVVQICDAFATAGVISATGFASVAFVDAGGVVAVSGSAGLHPSAITSVTAPIIKVCFQIFKVVVAPLADPDRRLDAVRTFTAQAVRLPRSLLQMTCFSTYGSARVVGYTEQL